MNTENKTMSCPAKISVDPTDSINSGMHSYNALAECGRCYFTLVSREYTSFSKDIAYKDARTEAEIALRPNCLLNQVVRDHPLSQQRVNQYQ